MACTSCQKMSMGRKQQSRRSMGARPEFTGGDITNLVKWGGIIWLVSKGLNLFGANGNGKEPPPPGELPEPEIPLTPQQIADDFKAAELIYQVLKGPAITDAQIALRHAVLQAYQGVAVASPNQFVDIYNQFTQNFGGGESLRQWIRDEAGLDNIIENNLMNAFNKYQLQGLSNMKLGQSWNLREAVGSFDDDLTTVAGVGAYKGTIRSTAFRPLCQCHDGEKWLLYYCDTGTIPTACTGRG